MPAEVNEMDADKVVAEFNKLYKKKFKYTERLKIDGEKLEIYKKLKKLEEIM